MPKSKPPPEANWPTYPPPGHPSPLAPKTENIAYHRLAFTSWTRRFPLYLYHASFTFLLLILAALLAASAFGLAWQAWRTSGGQKRWNIAILVAAYVALGIIAIIHVWSRVLSVKKVIRTMPKPYMPTKRIDVPKVVADHISTEYTRTAVIAHISQATTGTQDGWGRPGTRWENTHFRSYILGTVPEMQSIFAIPPSTPRSPVSLDPILEATIPLDGPSDAGSTSEPKTVRLLVNSWAALVSKARWGRREPGEMDADNVEKLVTVLRRLVEKKRARLVNGDKVEDSSEGHDDG